MAKRKVTMGGIVVFVLALIAMALAGTIGKMGSEKLSQNLGVSEISIGETCDTIAQSMTDSHSEQVFHDGLLHGDEVVCDEQTVVYRYSFPDVVHDQEVIEAIQIDRRAATPVLLRTYCQRMQPMVMKNIAARWEYRDRNGVILYSVLAQPEDCKM